MLPDLRARSLANHLLANSLANERILDNPFRHSKIYTTKSMFCWLRVTEIINSAEKCLQRSWRSESTTAIIIWRPVNRIHIGFPFQIQALRLSFILPVGRIWHFNFNSLTVSVVFLKPEVILHGWAGGVRTYQLIPLAWLSSSIYKFQVTTREYLLDNPLEVLQEWPTAQRRGPVWPIKVEA